MSVVLNPLGTCSVPVGLVELWSEDWAKSSWRKTGKEVTDAKEGGLLVVSETASSSWEELLAFVKIGSVGLDAAVLITFLCTGELVEVSLVSVGLDVAVLLTSLWIRELV